MEHKNQFWHVFNFNFKVQVTPKCVFPLMKCTSFPNYFSKKIIVTIYLLPFIPSNEKTSTSSVCFQENKFIMPDTFVRKTKVLSYSHLCEK